MIESLLIWLQQYIRNNQGRYLATAVLLVNELPYIDTLEQLYHLFYKAKTPDRFMMFYVDMPDKFLQKRKEVLCKIAELQQLIANFNSWKPTEENNVQIKHLIELIHDILSNPRSRLNDRLFGVLKIINHFESWQQIIDHLRKQPTVLCPSFVTLGSFNAYAPINEKHSSCLELLRNNSATYNPSNDSSKLANQFLQSLLILYQEIHMSLQVAPLEPLPIEKTCLQSNFF